MPEISTGRGKLTGCTRGSRRPKPQKCGTDGGADAFSASRPSPSVATGAPREPRSPLPSFSRSPAVLPLLCAPDARLRLPGSDDHFGAVGLDTPPRSAGGSSGNSVGGIFTPPGDPRLQPRPHGRSEDLRFILAVPARTQGDGLSPVGGLPVNHLITIPARRRLGRHPLWYKSAQELPETEFAQRQSAGGVPSGGRGGAGRRRDRRRIVTDFQVLFGVEDLLGRRG